MKTHYTVITAISLTILLFVPVAFAKMPPAYINVCAEKGVTIQSEEQASQVCPSVCNIGNSSISITKTFRGARVVPPNQFGLIWNGRWSNDHGCSACGCKLQANTALIYVNVCTSLPPNTTNKSKINRACDQIGSNDFVAINTLPTGAKTVQPNKLGLVWQLHSVNVEGCIACSCTLSN